MVVRQFRSKRHEGTAGRLSLVSKAHSEGLIRCATDVRDLDLYAVTGGHVDTRVRVGATGVARGYRTAVDRGSIIRHVNRIALATCWSRAHLCIKVRDNRSVCRRSSDVCRNVGGRAGHVSIPYKAKALTVLNVGRREELSRSR